MTDQIWQNEGNSQKDAYCRLLQFVHVLQLLAKYRGYVKVLATDTTIAV